MSDLPEPLVPAEVDLTGFPSFGLNVERLLASELVALCSPQEGWAALMLWARAWQQKPPGSLPNDEKVLAAFSRAKSWKQVREMALRGFILCADGRLYHPMLAAEALRCWESRLKYEADKAKNAEKLRSWRAAQQEKNQSRACVETTDVTGYETGSVTGYETGKKGKGIGEGEVKNHPSSNGSGTPRANDFDDDHVPKAPIEWAKFFDAEHGVQTDTYSVKGREKLWPLAQGWIDAGLSIGRMRAAIAKAKADTTEPIMYLPSYVNQVLVNAQTRAARPPKPIPLHALDMNQLNAEGKRWGLEARPGETPHAFIGRIQVAQAEAQGRVTA